MFRWLMENGFVYVRLKFFPTMIDIVFGCRWGSRLMITGVNMARTEPAAAPVALEYQWEPGSATLWGEWMCVFSTFETFSL